jgi:hypothetical protein
MFGSADAGNKPLSSAKVKPGARMTAARQCGTLCETDHITDRSESIIGLPGTVCTGQTARCGSVATDAFIPFIRPALSRLIVAISHGIASG